MILEEKEGLEEGEEEMHDVDENKHSTLAGLLVRTFKVGGNVQTIQGDTAKCES